MGGKEVVNTGDASDGVGVIGDEEEAIGDAWKNGEGRRFGGGEGSTRSGSDGDDKIAGDENNGEGDKRDKAGDEATGDS